MTSFFIYGSSGWPGRRDKYDQRVGPIQHKYLTDGFMSPWRNVQEKGLRVLPIEVTIEDASCVLPYEELRTLALGAEIRNIHQLRLERPR
jgi:hypothetical protein